MLRSIEGLELKNPRSSVRPRVDTAVPSSDMFPRIIHEMLRASRRSIVSRLSCERYWTLRPRALSGRSKRELNGLRRETWCVVFCQNQLSATSPVLVSASAIPVTPRRHLVADWTMKGDAGIPEHCMKINRKFRVHETGLFFRGFAPLSSGHDLRVSILKRRVGRRLSRGCVEGPRTLSHPAGVTTWRFDDRGCGQ